MEIGVGTSSEVRIRDGQSGGGNGDADLTKFVVFGAVHEVDTFVTGKVSV